MVPTRTFKEKAKWLNPNKPHVEPRSPPGDIASKGTETEVGGLSTDLGLGKLSLVPCSVMPLVHRQ